MKKTNKKKPQSQHFHKLVDVFITDSTLYSTVTKTKKKIVMLNTHF